MKRNIPQGRLLMNYPCSRCGAWGMLFVPWFKHQRCPRCNYVKQINLWPLVLGERPNGETLARLSE